LSKVTFFVILCEDTLKTGYFHEYSVVNYETLNISEYLACFI